VTQRIERAPMRNPARRQGELGFLPGEDEVTDGHPQRPNPNPQIRQQFIATTYEYWAPFNYPNVSVELGRTIEGFAVGGEYNPDGVELDFPPYGAITLEEEDPIVSVTVIGSACQSPGYVILHGEPLEWKYPRTAVKMMINNLWGEHIYYTDFRAGTDEGTYRAGLSSARFDIPDCKKVTLMGGSSPAVMNRRINDSPTHDADPWTDHYVLPDGHYNFRTIRITVKTR
jgi:hypothetical protein